jgi:hypothetical protein
MHLATGQLPSSGPVFTSHFGRVSVPSAIGGFMVLSAIGAVLQPAVNGFLAQNSATVRPAAQDMQSAVRALQHTTEGLVGSTGRVPSAIGGLLLLTRHLGSVVVTHAPTLVHRHVLHPSLQDAQLAGHILAVGWVAPRPPSVEQPCVVVGVALQYLRNGRKGRTGKGKEEEIQSYTKKEH